MLRLTGCLMLLAALMILVVGCSDEPDPMMSGSSVKHRGLAAALSIPPGSTLESATLHIYLTETYYRTITVQRITDSWDETVVTWNNFGGAYAPDLFGTFEIFGLGWREADVTGLVAGWLNGTYSNYGMLLDQERNLHPRNAFNSREAGTHTPYLEICYTTASGTVCEQILADGDTYIDQYLPDMNAGLSATLFTGKSISGCSEIYLSLIKFEGPNGAPELAAIGDTVWFDEDQDGIQDAGEPGIAGVTVNLLDCSNVQVATMTTDANGYYLFAGLLPGDYKVEFVAPEGYVFTAQNQGTDDAIDSDADPVTGRTMCTTLEGGETDVTWDAGLYEEPDYGECEGKVTQLTVRYDGSIVDAHIVVKQKKNIVVFDGIVQPGEEFTFYGADKKGTFGPETYYYVNGVFNTNIHTSCSQPIGPGLTKGDFTVIEGYSRHGGLLPPL